jgi:hypothetical protein
MFSWGPWNNRSGTMAIGRQLKAAILVRRAAKRARKKRTRPEPLQCTVADQEGARDRVATAERRIATTTAEAIPTGDARGWSGRCSTTTLARPP